MSDPSPPTRADESKRFVGALLAAGRSRRMGRPKQLLPWPPGSIGGATVASASYDLLASRCDAMLVVLGHEAGAVRAALGSRDAAFIETDPEAPMFESIRAALRWSMVHQPGRSLMLHPADHPAVRIDTVSKLLDAFREHRESMAVMPEYGGRGGHPALMPARLLPEIAAWSGEGGLRRFWIDHPEICVRIRIDDEAVVRDLDEPGDYK